MGGGKRPFGADLEGCPKQSENVDPVVQPAACDCGHRANPLVHHKQVPAWLQCPGNPHNIVGQPLAVLQHPDRDRRLAAQAPCVQRVQHLGWTGQEVGRIHVAHGERPHAGAVSHPDDLAAGSIDQRLRHPPDAAAVVEYQGPVGQRDRSGNEIGEVGCLGCPTMLCACAIFGQDDAHRLIQVRDIEDTRPVRGADVVHDQHHILFAAALAPCRAAQDTSGMNESVTVAAEAPHYDFRAAEPRWQRAWAERGCFRVDDVPTDGKPKYYVMEMFPYPSGKIHMGHVRNYTLGDVVARYKRARGFSVLHPMGWDAFGLPAENAARERNIHPAKWTRENIAAMRSKLQLMGLSLEWEREFATSDPEYYGHQQKLFLDFLRAGLVERKQSWVNWDPVDGTVLANEQVIDGRGWRSGALVEKKQLSQWFLKITAYAQDLLDALATLDRWPERVRLMQERWIGRSEGARLTFLLVQPEACFEGGEVYTTRPDTLFGMSFLALAPEHPLSAAVAARDPKAAEFIAECRRLGTSEAAIETAEKRGYDTGLRVKHPFLPNTTFPVWIANFVLMEYGTGAIFGCPAHDQRDLEFARKYGLSVVPVVLPPGEDPATFAVGDEAYVGPGSLINSEFLNGLDVDAAMRAAIEALVRLGCGSGEVNWRLRDWGVSRQRYWGCPIPIIHCEACGVVPVPDDQLPVRLPEDVTFDRPGNPLDHHPTWKHVDCPSCGKPARRETDTFDTFVDSSWYFARYCSPRAEVPVVRAAADHWMPVDQYIGGIEHAILHLLYSRFF